MNNSTAGNDEYSYYTEDFRRIHFEKKLKALKRKYKNKKILLYGNGIYFDAIADNYNLKDYLNIIGVSDVRYEKNPVEYYKEFKTFTPDEIKKLDIDVILVTTVYPYGIIGFLKRFELLNNNVIIDSIVQINPLDEVLKFLRKMYWSLRYCISTLNPIEAIKYFTFCKPKEIRSKVYYNNVLKRIKRYPKNRKIRVVFICEENAKWGYQSVYDELKSDGRFEILPIVCLPILTKNRSSWTQAENIEFFKKLNINAIDGYDKEKEEYIELKSFNPDIVFYQQHWYSISVMPPFDIAKYALTGVVSYGFTSVDAKIWGMGAPRKFCANLWKMFAESEYHKKFYENATQLKHKDILTVSGYPKLDCYKIPINSEFEKLWKDENKTEKHRIIWAPHHSIEHYGFGMSNFKEQAWAFLDYAKKHPQYSFLVKPHPALKFKCILDGFMSAQEFDAYLSQWNNLPNSCVYDKGNYFDIFKTSDVLVTDSSSFLGEYYVSTKPIIFFESASRTPFNEFGSKIKKGFYMPKTLDDMDKMLKEILIDKKDDLKPLRENIIKEEIYLPQEGVGKKIVNIIKKEVFGEKCE